MIGGMPWLHRHKSSATGGRHFVMSDRLAFDDRAIVFRFDDPRAQLDWFVGRRGTLQSNCVISRDGTRRMIKSGLLHQVIRRRPITMTIKQSADDPAAQHSRKRFLISFRIESRDDLIALRKTADVQTFLIGGPATEAGHVRRVSFLETFFV